jgi:hypothetical protein
MRIHFGSGGNFLHFYLGIAAKMQSKGLIINHLSGVSAGTFAASFLAYDIDINKNYFDWNNKLCNELQNTEKTIDSFLNVTKPLFENKKCIISLDIWTSKIQVPDSIFKLSETQVISHKFCGEKDIFDKIACSCYLPIFCPNKTLVYHYNDDYFLDGVLTFNKETDYNLIINYKDFIKNFKFMDKLPSSNIEKNVKLFELGKESFNLRLND